MTRYQKILGALTIAGTLASGSVAFAQTTTPRPATSTTPNVTAPNTGVGGDAAQNIALLGGSALILLAGAVYLGRKEARA
jgi:hypothetical protein